MIRSFHTFLFICVNLLLEYVISENSTVNQFPSGNQERILSRRKRYLTFPEGSSFQLADMHYHIFLYFAISLLWLVEAFNMIAPNMSLSANSRDLDGEHVSKVLSRRKRFLTFPDGSSFQLVFCTQNHGYLQVGDIVWFGSTAALAWELPTDPQLFKMFQDNYKGNEAKKRSDMIYYVDDEGKVISSAVYKRKIIVNPAFAKRSITSQTEKKNRVSAKEMHRKYGNINLFKDLDIMRIDFHRKGRKNFYAILEKFLHGLGWNGKMCVLRMLCEAGQAKSEQGTFVEEIVTALFMLPKSQNFEPDAQKYDEAHGTDADCSQLYSECTLSY